MKVGQLKMNLMEKYLKKLSTAEIKETEKDILLEPKPVPVPAMEDYQTLFGKVVDDVSRAYLPGTLEMIQEDFPELAEEMQEAEDQVNDLWLRAKEGAGDMGAFRDAVDRWKSFHLRAIRFNSLTDDRKIGIER